MLGRRHRHIGCRGLVKRRCETARSDRASGHPAFYPRAGNSAQSIAKSTASYYPLKRVTRALWTRALTERRWGRFREGKQRLILKAERLQLVDFPLRI